MIDRYNKLWYKANINSLVSEYITESFSFLKADSGDELLSFKKVVSHTMMI